MSLLIISLMGTGITVNKAKIHGFFYDPSLFLVNPTSQVNPSPKIPAMATALIRNGCGDCGDQNPGLSEKTLYCYNTTSPSDWAFWDSECFKSSDGITVDLYWNDDGSNDSWCDDSYRASSNYTGTNALNYVLANHNIGYLDIFPGGSSGPPEGGYDILGSGSYTESNEACFVDCYSTSPYMNSSNMLGDELLLYADAGYPGVVFDVGPLTAGVTYVFYTYSYPTGGSFDPYMAVHRGQNNATDNWQARGEYLNWLNNTGPGQGEAIQFTAPVSGRYGLMIGQWNQGTAPQDTFGVGFYPYFSSLSNETPSTIPDGALARWVQPDTVHRWALVGTKPGPSDDYDVFIKATHDINAIWEPAILGYSDNPSNDVTDFVLVNYHNNFGNAITGVDWFARLNKASCNRQATGEWSRSHGILSDTGTYGPFNYTSDEVGWSWDIIPVLCDSSDTNGLIIELDITSGTVDLGFAVADPDAGDFQGRQDVGLVINDLGAGGDESGIWSPDDLADTYGLAVFSENFSSGTFNIVYRCPEPAIDVNEGGVPHEFYARLMGNVSHGTLALELGLPGDSKVHLALYDATGRPAINEDLGRMSPGVHAIREDVSSLSKGVYFLMLSTQMGEVQKKIVLR